MKNENDRLVRDTNSKIDALELMTTTIEIAGSSTYSDEISRPAMRSMSMPWKYMMSSRTAVHDI